MLRMFADRVRAEAWVMTALAQLGPGPGDVQHEA
jgi:hypothetical protein